ncbi:hypothetical protein C8J57DRAFT_1226409 [Mycena rebaudengoi]|nr:hypothetical protein C8J57DRAFT_1226409 [Mycena rebaudengoi]
MEVSRGASEKIAKILEDPKRLGTVLDALPLPGLPARIDKGKSIVQNLGLIATETDAPRQPEPGTSQFSTQYYGIPHSNFPLPWSTPIYTHTSTGAASSSTQLVGTSTVATPSLIFASGPSVPMMIRKQKSRKTCAACRDHKCALASECSGSGDRSRCMYIFQSFYFKDMGRDTIHIPLGAVIATSIQAYYCYRLWGLSQKWWVAPIMLILVSLVAAIITASVIRKNGASTDCFWLAKMACARAEWLVSDLGLDFGGITSPSPAFRLASHFVPYHPISFVHSVYLFLYKALIVLFPGRIHLSRAPHHKSIPANSAAACPSPPRLRVINFRVASRRELGAFPLENRVQIHILIIAEKITGYLFQPYFEMPRPRTISTIRTALTRSRAAGLRTCTEGVSVRCAVLAIVLSGGFWLTTLGYLVHMNPVTKCPPKKSGCVGGQKRPPYV